LSDLSQRGVEQWRHGQCQHKARNKDFTANNVWFSKCSVGQVAHRNHDQPIVVSRDRVLDFQ